MFTIETMMDRLNDIIATSPVDNDQSYASVVGYLLALKDLQVITYEEFTTARLTCKKRIYGGNYV